MLVSAHPFMLLTALNSFCCSCHSQCLSQCPSRLQQLWWHETHETHEFPCKNPESTQGLKTCRFHLRTDSNLTCWIRTHHDLDFWSNVIKGICNILIKYKGSSQSCTFKMLTTAALASLPPTASWPSRPRQGVVLRTVHVGSFSMCFQEASLLR